MLVCEDEPDARELIESILVECKATVVVDRLGRRGHGPLPRGACPTCCVSDIGMPDASGYELIRQVRALPPEKGGRMPAVALTAYASMNDRTRALMEGSRPTPPSRPSRRSCVAVIAALVGRRGRAAPRE